MDMVVRVKEDRKYHESKKIGRGSLYILLGRIAMIFLGALNVTLVPRILGPTNMGFYSYWLSVFLILLALLDLGGYSILIRYLPELRKRNQSSVRPLIKKTIELKFPFILLIFLGGLFVFSRERYYFLIIFLASTFFSISMIIQAGLYAYGDMKKYALLRFSRVLTRFILILVLFIVLGSIGILYGILVGAILVTFISGFFIIKLLPKTSGSLEKPIREYLTFGLFVYLGSSFSVLTTWSSVVLSKKYIPDMDLIGFLGLGLQICLVAIGGIVLFVGESVFPSLVEFHVTNYEKFKRSLELNWKYTNMILFPIISGFFILSKPVITIVVGEGYLPTVEIIDLFLPAIVFITWTGIHRQILLIFEKKKEIFLSQFIGFVVFLICGLILIKNLGITGAPIAVSLGTFIGFICMYLVSARTMKIHSYLSHIIRPFMASAGMSIILSLVVVNTIITLLGTITFGASIYFILMMLIKGITRDDIERVKNIF